MAILIHDCPHCGARRVGFTGANAVQKANVSFAWTFFMVCPACTGGIVVTTYDNGHGVSPEKHTGLLTEVMRDGSKQTILVIHPRPDEAVVPEALPDKVAKAFKEGCDIVSSSPNGACAMFRRALEIGLKELSPEVEAWKLEKRIDKLAAAHRLTPAIRDWAHQLRLDGNEAVHGEEDASVELATEMKELTRYVLMYLYTLPNQVEAARARSAAA